MDYRDETHLVGDMRWSDRIIENGLWEKNLYNFITKVYPKLVSDFPTPFHMKDSLQRIDESRLHIAAREALSNLVIHADFNEKPCTLLIIKKEDFLYFSNSGMLRMSLEEVLHGGTSLARNTTVQKILRFIGFGESAGSGFDKILAPSRKEGYIMPDLTEREGIRSTVLKLWTVKKSVHQTEQIKDIDLSDNQKFIYNLLKENPGLSIKQIKEKCDFNSNAVEYAIRILREKHFITYSRSENDSTKGYFII